MIVIENFITGFSEIFSEQHSLPPWEITSDLSNILRKLISQLDHDFDNKDGVAIHKSAHIEKGVVLKAPIIINKDCFVGANAYLRGGVYLGSAATVGPNCEIKTSIILANSTMGHLNFIGDSIIGNNVNFEAGAITANHHNERTEKKIQIFYQSKMIHTGTYKFGSLVGDNSRIGANAVLSPGTLLPPNTIVKRLELIDQEAAHKH